MFKIRWPWQREPYEIFVIDDQPDSGVLTLQLRITKELIKKGYRRDPKSCPIALALLELGFVDPCVTASSVEFVGKGLLGTRNYYANLPRPVSRWMSSYDDKGREVPIEFTLHADRVA